jgi:hypothetical protein
MSRRAEPNLQYAVPPYRRRADGVMEIMLVISRDTSL